MKKCLVLILCLWVSVCAWADGFQAGTEYYIALNIYDKYLGLNEAGDGPALSALARRAMPATIRSWLKLRVRRAMCI